MKKNITFLIPSMNGGGAEKVTMLLANELSSRKWQVTILLSKREGPYLNKLYPEINIRVLRKRNISHNIFEIAKYLKTEKPGIFYSSMMYVNVIAGLASVISGFQGKLFLSEHSHLSTSIVTNKSVAIKIIVRLAKLLYRKADTVICVSEGVRQDITSVIKNIKNAVVINNPIENLARTEEIKKSSKYRMISVGRLDRNKNFRLLISAFNDILQEVDDKDNYELFILGEGPERGNLENLVTDLNLNQKVFLPGFVNTPSELLLSSDLFVFTSLTEGFGNVLVEALACGLPVISSDCESGPAEILQYGKIGTLVPVDDLESLKKAIIEEIKNSDSVSTKEQRIERAKDFSVKNIVDKYEDALLNY